MYSMCSWKHTVDKVAKIDQEILFKVLKEHSTKCEETILQIRWLGKIINDPCSIMQPFILLSQLCFSFNALPYYEMYKQTPYKLQNILEIGSKWSESKIDWNLDKGYNNENSSRPLRINSSGLRNSVEFVLTQKESSKGCSRNSGFIAYFHNPSDVPDYSHTSFAFSKGTHSFVQFKTYLSVTDQTLASWTPENRGCYFSDERPLMLTKIYSKTNCYYECQINYTQNICGCTPYYFISDLLPVCGLRMEYCFVNASMLAEGTTDICKCLPPCTQYDYSISYSTVPKDFENAQHSLPFLNNYTDSNYANFASIEIHTYHDNMWPLGRAVKETAIKRWGELTAVISLCLGVSFITIIEFFYYAVLRPIVMNVL
ncbi:pickpocket protein 28-like isoform X2 [Adelges cooleyi]|nr:pickpocket protein 28-like isoform X2 [Adelges cooleyi]